MGVWTVIVVLIGWVAGVYTGKHWDYFTGEE